MLASLTLGGSAPALANTVQDSADLNDKISSSSHQEKLVYLTEEQLSEIGLTKQDAINLQQEFASMLDQEVATGTISQEDADTLTQTLLDSRQSSSSGEATTYALPVWAAGAIVGCAGSVALGEGRDQVKNAFKENKSVDEATDIAIGVAVDCVFGAVPGGAIAASVKSALTKPIKDSLRTPVKKVVTDMKKRYDEGNF